MSLKSGADSCGRESSGAPRRKNSLTADICAAEITEIIPLVNRFMRSHVSQHIDPLPSLAQLRALGFLLRCPGASLSELADHLVVTKATASTMVDRMVHHGLLSRQEDPHERRFVILNATAAGIEHYERAKALAQEAVAQVLSKLPEQKLQAIYDGLSALREAFDSVPPPQHKIKQ